jgi:hypothetical protein
MATRLASIAERHEAVYFRFGLKDKDEKQMMRLLVADDKTQPVLDALRDILGPQPDTLLFGRVSLRRTFL